MISRVLKQNFRLLTLAPVAIAALFNAQAISAVVGGSMAARADELAQPPLQKVAGAGAAASPARPVSADPILQRNAFDSVTGSLLDAKDPVEPHDDGALVSCDGVRVVGIVNANDDDWSFAAFAAPGEQKTVLRRRGGSIAGKEVYFIGSDRVVLASGQSRCEVEMFRSPAAAVAVTAKPAERPPPAVGIARVSDTEFNVDRGALEGLLQNHAELMKVAQVTPGGIKMNNVRPESLAGQLGLKNGDVIKSVMGFDVTNPEKMLELYARIRQLDRVTIEGVRDGRPLNIQYNVR